MTNPAYLLAKNTLNLTIKAISFSFIHPVRLSLKIRRHIKKTKNKNTI
jgi:ABC-type polysaccharide transport system permease subunit